MGMNPAELCRRNFIQTFPHLPPVIMEYDTGDLFTILNTVQSAADVASFPARRADAAFRGKLRGIGHQPLLGPAAWRRRKRLDRLDLAWGWWERQTCG